MVSYPYKIQEESRGYMDYEANHCIGFSGAYVLWSHGLCKKVMLHTFVEL